MIRSCRPCDGGGRHSHEDGRALAGRRFDFERRADQCGALLHAEQPEALRRRRSRLAGSNPTPSSSTMSEHVIGAPLEDDLDVSRPARAWRRWSALPARCGRASSRPRRTDDRRAARRCAARRRCRRASTSPARSWPAPRAGRDRRARSAAAPRRDDRRRGRAAGRPLRAPRRARARSARSPHASLSMPIRRPSAVSCSPN